MLRDSLEIVGMVVATAGLGLGFFFYFTNAKVKMWVDRVIRRVPVSTLINVAASKVEDKEGVFDLHDSLKVMARLADCIKVAISDPTNARFEDVEEEVFTFLDTELSRYRDAGVRNVPEISDTVLRTNVKVVFEQIKRALSEDSTGNNS